MSYLRSMRLLTVLSSMAFNTHAAGQSEIVLYENIDLGIAVENKFSAKVGRGYNNWIGFAGQNSFGSGLSALFNVQARFNPDTGQQERPSTFFQGRLRLVQAATAGAVAVCVIDRFD